MPRKSKKVITKKRKRTNNKRVNKQSVNVIVKIDQSKRTNPRQQNTAGGKSVSNPLKPPHSGVYHLAEGLPFTQDRPPEFKNDKPKEEPKSNTTINLYDPNKKTGNDLTAPPTNDLLNVNQLVAGQIAPWINLFSQQLAQSTYKGKPSKNKENYKVF